VHTAPGCLVFPRSRKYSYPGSYYNYMVQVTYVLYEFSHGYQSAFADMKRERTIVGATNLGLAPSINANIYGS